MAGELLRELAPLLAEEGIDVDNIDVPDLGTLQQARGRAIERHNMTRFTPVGHARDLAVTALRHASRRSSPHRGALTTTAIHRHQPARCDDGESPPCHGRPNPARRPEGAAGHGRGAPQPRRCRGG